MRLFLLAADILADAWKNDKSVSGIDGAANVNSALHHAASPNQSMRCQTKLALPLPSLTTRPSSGGAEDFTS